MASQQSPPRGFWIVKTNYTWHDKNHSKVVFRHQGQHVVLTHNDFLKKLRGHCNECSCLQAEVYDYMRIEKRVYPRRKLYHEVNEFLKRFRLSLTEKLRQYLLFTVLNDRSTSYRKLHLERIHTKWSINTQNRIKNGVYHLPKTQREMEKISVVFL